MMENWQSEYLQFTLFILLTVWLVQRGSPESKELHKAGRESDEEQKVGEHADPGSPRWPQGGRDQAHDLRELAAARDGRHMGRLLVRPGGHGGDRVQRRAPWPPAGRGLLGRVPDAPGVLGEDPAELAVRVLVRGLDGDPRGLPAPARLARVEARRRPTRRDGRRGVNDPSVAVAHASGDCLGEPWAEFVEVPALGLAPVLVGDPEHHY